MLNSLQQRVVRLFALAIISALTIAIVSCDRRPGEPVSRSEMWLGTVTSVVIHDSRFPSTVLDRVFERVEEIQWRMTINEPDSEVSLVNAAAGNHPVRVSPDTFEVIEMSLAYARHTNGAFDPTIAPLVKLWDIGSESERVPTESEIEEALSFINYTLVELNPDNFEVYLPVPGMALDLGGIAKGYAVDEAARILKDAGIQHALVDFGGDVYTIGSRPDGNRWRIGIQDPVNTARGRFVGIVEQTGRSIVSSGDYERYFVEDGVRYHHILDPDTGHPARSGLVSVTVQAPTAITSDAVSTGAFVMGLEAGMALVERLPDTEGVFVTEDKQVYLSSGLDGSFRLIEAGGFRLQE
ncbi:MAG: FAD:protein FMN transferase [Spirochaetaceae bacterium]|nr:MAG: FAD:protein FMN transferase [Spirochaetaceae bacterium]